jgi:hypothetical protein
MSARSHGNVPVPCPITGRRESSNGGGEFGCGSGKEKAPRVKARVDGPVGLDLRFVEW